MGQGVHAVCIVTVFAREGLVALFDGEQVPKVVAVDAVDADMFVGFTPQNLMTVDSHMSFVWPDFASLP